MKPNFALNLSHEGISLLHRATAGWLPVGNVALDDPALNDHLKLLRKTAADLESGGLTSKLIIPNSQVLYTEVEAPGPDTAARISQIRDGLVGLTPYDVDDLVFDWRLTGRRAQVAVVARETLHEAEAFAAEFRFNPVSFVAAPMDRTFDGEPFFGPTRHAASLLEDGETVEPDDDVMDVLVAGKARATGPRRKPEPEAEATVEPEQVGAAGPQDEATAKPAKPKAKKPRVKAKPKAKPNPDPATEPEPEVEPEPRDPLPLTFASRRAAATVPDHRSPPPPDPVQPAPAPEQPDLTARFSHTTALDIDDVPEMPAWRTLNGGEVTPMPVTAAHTADPLPDPPRATARKPATRDKAQAAARNTAKVSGVAGVALAGNIGKLGQGTAAGVMPLREHKEALEAASAEADAMTVFGARGAANVGGKPRLLGLMLTLLLLVALAILALWSTFFLGDDTGSNRPPAASERPQVAAIAPEPAPEPAPAPAPPVEPTAPMPEAAPPAQPDPEPEPEPEPPANPIDAAVEVALADAPDPDEAAPGPVQPDITAPPDINAPPDVPVQPDIAVQPDIPARPGIPAPPDLPALVVDPAPDQVTRPPPTRAEAETSYAATGIWQLDPEPLPGATGGDRLENLTVAAVDPAISTPGPAGIPGAESLGGDLRPPTLTPPSALGTRYDLDERGLVRATPEGALSPDGVRVFAGAPPYVPAPRPGTVVPVAETPQAELPETPETPDIPENPETPETPAPVEDPAPDPERERLRQIRPPARPETLQETNERPSGLSQGELAAIRPSIRPLSLQEQRASLVPTAPAPDPEQDPAADVAAEPPAPADPGTELAVTASRTPATRPRDFSSTVAKALAEAAENPAKPEPEVAAARVPSVPTRASVAKQATVRNAINLGKINLIGVYGSSSDRRALIRLKSGRYVKVEVGDQIDGGRVAAIGDNELRYIKGGRNITLTLPQG